MKTRFIREIGIAGFLRIYWDKVTREKVPEESYTRTRWFNSCPAKGLRPASYHNAMRTLGSSSERRERYSPEEIWGKPEMYDPSMWPTKCEDCGEEVPAPFTGERVLHTPDLDITYQVFARRLYDTPEGTPVPGDLFFQGCYYHNDEGKCWTWDNCAGENLICVLPNGHEWNIDGRCSNCGSPDDKLHRCWIRTGDPRKGEPVHVSKGTGQPTCSAGAGSIQAGNFHGFLHNGEIT